MTGSLLVSTSTALVLVEHGRVHTVHTGAGIYFGLTWDRDHVFVLCRNNQRHGPVRRLFGQTSTLEVLDKNFVHVDTVACHSVRDPHQAIERDGAIYMANTGRDRIEVYRGGAFSRINWTGQHRDVHHINSVWFTEQSFYVLENNKLESSSVRIFDLNWQSERTVRLGQGAHNLYRSGNHLYTCSSATRRMLRHDLASGEELEVSVADRQWVPRGLARGPGCFYLGLSAEGTRAERHGGHPGRVVATDEQFAVLDTVEIAGAGQVNEVRLVSDLDAAHNGVAF